MPTRALFTSEEIAVEVDDRTHVVKVTRSAVPYATPQAGARSFEDAARACDAVDRARHGFLLDVRQAPGRNDPEFEAAMALPRRALFADWRKRAVLVRTTVGKLQIARISREQAREHVDIFMDEAEALAFVLR